MKRRLKWPFAPKPSITPLQMAGMIYALVVEQGLRDRECSLGFPLKRPASEALFNQCRLYRDAGAELMLKAKVLNDTNWQSVLSNYQMLLNDNPKTASRDQLDLAGKRLAWIRLKKENDTNIADIQEWGLS